MWISTSRRLLPRVWYALPLPLLEPSPSLWGRKMENVDPVLATKVSTMSQSTTATHCLPWFLPLNFCNGPQFSLSWICGSPGLNKRGRWVEDHWALWIPCHVCRSHQHSSSAPGLDQWLLWGLLNTFVFAYLDNILIFSKGLHEHLKHVHRVLSCFLKDNLFVKCEVWVPCERSFLPWNHHFRIQIQERSELWVTGYSVANPVDVEG